MTPEQASKNGEHMAHQLAQLLMNSPQDYGVPATEAPQLAALFVSTARQIGQPLDVQTRVQVEQAQQAYQAAAEQAKAEGQQFEPGTAFYLWGMADAMMRARLQEDDD